MTIDDLREGHSDWTGFDRTIELPQEYVAAHLLLHLKGSGTALLDDVSIRRVTR